jgi:ABC-type transport system substrate-binding protein
MAVREESCHSSEDRRTFLKRVGVAGASATVASWLPAPGAAAAMDATIRAERGAKRGGTLRYGVNAASTHFDVHQSGTVANIGVQGPMYDTLLRRSSKDGQTIIPDLAWKWDISPDGKKYTFHLRRGVKFHDGADFTAEDVKATYERIARPPKGVVIPRTPLFAAVGDIVVLDPHRIEFRLTEPRPKPFMLGAFASGWNIIVRKKTLEEHGGDLRRVMAYPGTGPFKHVFRKDKEVQAMLKEHLNIECNVRVLQDSRWSGEVTGGNFDLGINSITSTLMDPSDYFSAWYGKDGRQNYSYWTNPAFHDLARQIERELADNRRHAMVRKAEEILERDPPLIPVAYDLVYDAWYNKVQNPSRYFGMYDVTRWDQVWLR